MADDVSDEELMRMYLNGDLRAFENLYARHSGRVYAYLRKKLPQKEEQDEVFQKTFLKFHNSRGKFDFSYKVLQWLFVIARTSLLDHLRNRGRQESLIENLSIEKNGVESQETSEAERASEFVENLPEKQRQIVQMRAIEELSYEEIAKKLGQSEVSIRKNFSRAVKKLRGMISNPAEGSS
jgi:RNA polymerase sigma-70 factor (ECF subfamily)